MRALFYTLILSSILIIGVVLLYRTDSTRSPRRSGAFDLEPVASRHPLPLTSLNEKELEKYGLDELYSTGVEFWERWHAPEAGEVFKQVAKKDSLRSKVFIRLAECSANPAMPSEIEVARYLKQAASLSGGDDRYVSALRAILLDGKYDEAAENLRKLLKEEPGNVDAMYYLSRALFEQGKVRQAEEQIERLLREDESHGRGTELLIGCMMADGEVEEAERVSKDLASIYPGEPYPYVLLTLVEIVKGDFEAAREFCNNAINLDPRYVPSIFIEGHLYSVEGELEAAHVSFEKLLLFDDPSLEASARDALAYVDFLSGNFDEAVDEMDEAVRLLMNSGSNRRAYKYLFRLVDHLCELGQGKSAEEIVNKWSPELEKIPLQLARLRLEISAGELDSAKHVLHQIKDRSEWQRWMMLLRADYEEMLALTLLKEEDFQTAIGTLVGMAELSLSPVKANYLRGYASFESGKAEEATDYFEAALRGRFKPWFPYHEDPILWVQALFYLAESSVARGDIESAKEYYESFLSYWQDASWELEAVNHARRKLETLSDSTGDGKKGEN